MAVVMAVSVAVSMAMPMSMIVSSVCVAVVECKDTHQINNQTDKTDKQESIRAHFWRMH